MDKNVEMFNNNILINQNVLEAINMEFKRYFLFIRVFIRPNSSKFPMDETMIHEDLLIHQMKAHIQKNKKFNVEITINM